jgi:lysozyme
MTNSNTQAKHSKLTKTVGGATAAALLVSMVPKFEGVILRGHKDPIGIVTACAGHTKTAVLGRPYSKEECEALLYEDLIEHAEGVNRCVKVPLNAGQMAAAVSFTYNVGVRRFCQSTMAKKFNAMDYAGACAELSRWTTAGGIQFRGLVIRRAAERAVCEGKY